LLYARQGISSPTRNPGFATVRVLYIEKSATTDRDRQRGEGEEREERERG